EHHALVGTGSPQSDESLDVGAGRYRRRARFDRGDHERAHYELLGEGDELIAVDDAFGVLAAAYRCAAQSVLVGLCLRAREPEPALGAVRRRDVARAQEGDDGLRAADVGAELVVLSIRHGSTPPERHVAAGGAQDWGSGRGKRPGVTVGHG